MPAYRIRTVFSGVPGTPYLNNFYFDTGTVGDASSAAAAVYDFWNAVDGQMVNTIAWNIEDDVPLFTNPETIAGWESVAGGSGAGLLSGDSLPWSTQLLVQWSTATVFNNRRIRGRTFVPGFSENQNSAGVPIISLRDAVETAADALAGTGLVIASRAANTFVPVTSAQVWSQWAVLRSRRD